MENSKEDIDKDKNYAKFMLNQLLKIEIEQLKNIKSIRKSDANICLPDTEKITKKKN